MDKYANALVHRLCRRTPTAAVENPAADATMPPEGGIAGASDSADSGRAIRPGEDAEQVGQLVAHFAAIDDQVDRAVVEQELGALEAFGQGLAHGLLDHPRTGETDQCLRLADVDVA